MKKMFSIALLALVGLMATAQEKDPKAKMVLDEVSAKTKSYTSIKAEFVLETEGKDKKKETQQGSILVKGDKYRLEIKGQTIYCDGKSTWTYLKDANEVQINNVDPNANEGLSPSTIFTMYEKGFKYKYDHEEVSGGVAIDVVNLYPAQPEKKKFHTARLTIDKTKKQVIGIKMMMKDGTTLSYTIKTFIPNAPATDAEFTFDKKAHPKVTETDLRD